MADGWSKPAILQDMNFQSQNRKTFGHLCRSLYLTTVEFAYNNAEQSSTKMSPFYCDLGWHPRVADTLLVHNDFSNATIVDRTTTFLDKMNSILRKAKQEIHSAQERQAHYADERRREDSFKVGDLVWLSATHITTEADRACPTRKFNARYFGPFAITSMISKVAYKLDLPATWKIHPVFHVSCLKPYKSSPAEFGDRQPTRPPPEIIGGQEEYEVETILDKRIRHNRTEYLVKWKGYDKSEATWQTRTDLANATAMIRAYERKASGTRIKLATCLVACS
jgi:hypothetical protein